MQHFEGSATPVLYIGRTVLKGSNAEFNIRVSIKRPSKLSFCSRINRLVHERNALHISLLTTRGDGKGRRGVEGGRG